MKIEKGQHLSPSTEFKPGEHWRDKKKFWDFDWLYSEYVVKNRSSSDIAIEFGVTDGAIIHWLKKHGIKTRNIKESRAVKKWGLSGDKNGMSGRSGNKNPNWKGGITKDRQLLYASQQWKRVADCVRKRDKGICARCGVCKRYGRGMNIHHVIPFSVKAHRLDINNLVSLCTECHRFVHSNKNTKREFLK